MFLLTADLIVPVCNLLLLFVYSCIQLLTEFNFYYMHIYFIIHGPCSREAYVCRIHSILVKLAEYLFLHWFVFTELKMVFMMPMSSPQPVLTCYLNTPTLPGCLSRFVFNRSIILNKIDGYWVSII